MTGKPKAAGLAGLRLLIAEDDGLTGMQLEDQLADAGCVVVGCAVSLAQAIELATNSAADGAILDINLRGEMVYAAAEVLRSRGIPFVFLTGYDGANLPAAHRTQPIVQKPLEFDKLADILSGWRTPPA